ncbi:MAG: response regulator, partial [Anaerolineae bacterium]
MPTAKILYIEDDFRNRLLVRRILEAYGYSVVEAENGALGMQLAQEIDPDLILMDINLPEMDGYEATARL